MKQHCKDFSVDHLSPGEKTIAQRLIDLLPEYATGGGCKAFYSPKEWKIRGEKYGTESLLVVVHDGGDFASLCNLDYAAVSAYEKMQSSLHEVGLYMQQCTSWYSAVYAI